LIRSSVFFQSENGTTPAKVRAHVEYFPERGVLEVPTSYEKSLWILDQLLFQHQIHTFWARIDPHRSCQLIGWEETGVAHAFAAAAATGKNDTHTNTTTTATTDDDPWMHFQSLIQLLQSIPTIDVPQSILCCGLPQQQDNSSSLLASISVHAPAVTDTDVRLDLEAIAEQGADGVVMSSEALQHCTRDWKWEGEDRIPYTFPVAKQKI
jgi:hypothetical protein